MHPTSQSVRPSFPHQLGAITSTTDITAAASTNNKSKNGDHPAASVLVSLRTITDRCSCTAFTIYVATTTDYDGASDRLQ